MRCHEELGSSIVFPAVSFEVSLLARSRQPIPGSRPDVDVAIGIADNLADPATRGFVGGHAGKR